MNLLSAFLSMYNSKVESRKVSSFITNKKWVYVNPDGYDHIYIFKTDNELVLSIKGQANIGRWEFIPNTQSLIINQNDQHSLFNIKFVDQGLMLMKYDGTENPFYLLNDKIVPHHNIVRYFHEVVYPKLNISIVKLENDVFLEIHKGKSKNIEIGMRATINGDYITDGKYYTQSSYIYHVHNGVVSNITRGRLLSLLDNTPIRIEQINYNKITKGDEIYQGHQPLHDGVYKLNKSTHLHVQGGRIKKIKRKINVLLLAALIVAAALLVAYLISHTFLINKY